MVFPFPDCAAGLAGHVGASAHRVLSWRASLRPQNLLSVPFKSSLFLSRFLSLPPANAEEGRALQRAREPGEQEGSAGGSVSLCAVFSSSCLGEELSGHVCQRQVVMVGGELGCAGTAALGRSLGDEVGVAPNLSKRWTGSRLQRGGAPREAGDPRRGRIWAVPDCGVLDACRTGCLGENTGEIPGSSHGYSGKRGKSGGLLVLRLASALPGCLREAGNRCTQGKRRSRCSNYMSQ